MSRTGSELELNLINSFKSFFADLFCLGFWDNSEQALKEVNFDFGKSHQIYVIFDAEALVHSKLLAFPPVGAKDVRNDAIVWLFDVLQTNYPHLDRQLKSLSLTTEEGVVVGKSTVLIPLERRRRANGDAIRRVDVENKKIDEFRVTSSTLVDMGKFVSSLSRHSNVIRQLKLKWKTARKLISTLGEKLRESATVDSKTDGSSESVYAENPGNHADVIDDDYDDVIVDRTHPDDVSAPDATFAATHVAPADRFLMGNLVSISLADLFLGLAVASFFTSGFASPFSAAAEHPFLSCDKILASSQSIAFQLRRLILWLQGVPAGLKLNKELSLFMGNFFFYHIHLWLGYLAFIEPFLGIFLAAIPWLGIVGGFSSQMALIYDLLSCLSLHVYCFYVYASRVFFFLFRGFSSLFRLFRGKKKNPLRSRIDSCHFDFAQLFLGTLTFTILLFLFPTVLLYYIVFTALRIVTLGLQFFISISISFINFLPLYGIFLRCFSSSLTTNGMEVCIAEDLRVSGDKTGVIFHMSFQQASLIDVAMTGRDELTKFYGEENGEGKGENGENVVDWLNDSAKRLVRGELIKPWK